MHPVRLKRAYDPPSSRDGKRILVERLWPRGIRKAELQIDLWLKDIAPTPALRQWFDHDPKKWNTFRRRYFDELRSGELKKDALMMLLHCLREGPVTLVYGAADTTRNSAAALREYLERWI